MNSIAVIRARLPYVDRRALSEAWFSALHLAREGEPLARRRRDIASPGTALALRRRDIAPPGSALALRRRDIASPGTAGSFHPWNSRRLVNCFVAPASGLRSAQAPGSATSRRLAQAHADEALRNHARASFSIALDGGGRVQILLRREGRVLHVLALCSTRHVELVRRALACADLHLRARGEKVSSSVRAL